MRILVLGATGRTGRHLVDEACRQGHEVTALVRSPQKMGPSAARVVQGEATRAEDVARAASGIEAALVALGPAKGSPSDLHERAVEHLLAARVPRIVLLVNAVSRRDLNEYRPGGALMFRALSTLLAKDVRDKEAAIARLEASDAAWTVVRAPPLSDGPRTARYRSGRVALGMGSRIARADVAHFMLFCAQDPTFVGRMPTLAY